MIILWPIIYPLAKILDSLLGVHGPDRYEKNELKTIFELHEIKKKDFRSKNADLVFNIIIKFIFICLVSWINIRRS